jgi:hypothetical protein
MPHASQQFFEHDAKCEGHGLQCLVGGAFRNFKGTQDPDRKEEATFHLMLLSLLKDMSGVQQATLMELFFRSNANPSIWTNTCLPTTMSDATKIYLSGSNSIYRNTPHPNVFIHEQHACVKLRDVIEHMVAHGLDFDNIPLDQCRASVNATPISIKETQVAQEICESVRQSESVTSSPLILPIIFWSDDFEVTHVKSTTSVWVHTVTVFPLPYQATSP